MPWYRRPRRRRQRHLKTLAYCRSLRRCPRAAAFLLFLEETNTNHVIWDLLPFLAVTGCETATTNQTTRWFSWISASELDGTVSSTSDVEPGNFPFFWESGDVGMKLKLLDTRRLSRMFVEWRNRVDLEFLLPDRCHTLSIILSLRCRSRRLFRVAELCIALYPQKGLPFGHSQNAAIAKASGTEPAYE